ncbi:MAG: hypothetical protein A2623_02405 [Caulobacterales bacterium RIFCSPHIGHO2_01_FULL_70_19]|nr:MAG: hypothetical protein A2623_02405 [Caulobacterales bacterium RIFCSPHIGHO2_01_FULL_70_19]
MKRARWAKIAVAGALFLGMTACSGPPGQPAAGSAPQEGGGWTRTPAILAIRPVEGGLVVTGRAEPGGRVVLRNASGAAYAAAADAAGGFEIRIATSEAALLLRPEIQIGQDAAESPDRLLILGGGRGPVAVLGVGRPALRLDAAPALGAVDSDGRSALVSGRSTDDEPVTVAAGGPPTRLQPGPGGRWSVLTAAAPGEVIRVNGRDFVWPGPGDTAPGGLQVERDAGGWRVGWTGPGGARQWTWLPVAPAS